MTIGARAVRRTRQARPRGRPRTPGGPPAAGPSAAVRRALADVLGTPADGARTRLVLTACGILLVTADFFAIVIALPEVMADIGLRPVDLHRATPIVGVFLLGYALAMGPGGRLARAWGPRRTMLSALLVFALGALVAVTAASLTPLLIGRTLQGLGAGALAPASLAQATSRWDPTHREVPGRLLRLARDVAVLAGAALSVALLAVVGWRAVLWFDVVAALGLLVGLAGADDPLERRRRQPLDRAGAWLAGAAAAAAVALVFTPGPARREAPWKMLFEPTMAALGPTAPLGLSVLVLTAALVTRELRVPRGARSVLALRRAPRIPHTVDLAGIGLVGSAVAAVMVAFALGDARTPIEPVSIGLLAAAAAAAAQFARRERRARHPWIPARVLRSPAAGGVLASAGLLGAASGAVILYGPLFARAAVNPYSPVDAGRTLLLFLVPVPIGIAAGAALARRIDPRALAAGGSLLAAGGLAWMATWGPTALSGAGGRIAPVLAGLGVGVVTRPLSLVPAGRRSSARPAAPPAVISGARTTGMVLGLSLLTAVGLATYDHRLAAVPPAEVSCPLAPAQCAIYEQAVRSGVFDQLHAVFAAASGCAALAAAICLLLLVHRPVSERPSTRAG